MKPKAYAIGVDYGTNSCRALLVDVADGSELASHVFGYRTLHDGLGRTGRHPAMDEVMKQLIAIRHAARCG